MIRAGSRESARTEQFSIVISDAHGGGVPCTVSIGEPDALGIQDPDARPE